MANHGSRTLTVSNAERLLIRAAVMDLMYSAQWKMHAAPPGRLRTVLELRYKRLRWLASVLAEGCDVDVHVPFGHELPERPNPYWDNIPPPETTSV